MGVRRGCGGSDRGLCSRQMAWGHAAAVVPGVPVILQLATVRRQAGPEDPAMARGCCSLFLTTLVGWLVVRKLFSSETCRYG